nr:unnamed protein product [Digitaria exilis]
MEESCGMSPSPHPSPSMAAVAVVEARKAAAPAARRWARRVRKVRMGFSRTHASTNPIAAGRRWSAASQQRRCASRACGFESDCRGGVGGGQRRSRFAALGSAPDEVKPPASRC